MVGLLPVQYVDVSEALPKRTSPSNYLTFSSSDYFKRWHTSAADSSKADRRPSTSQVQLHRTVRYWVVAEQRRIGVADAASRSKLVRRTCRQSERNFPGFVRWCFAGEFGNLLNWRWLTVISGQDIGSDDLENNILTTTTTTVTKHVLPSPSPLTPNSDIVRETKTVRKTEVLHVDTANEPIS